MRFSVPEQELLFNKLDSNKEGFFTYSQFTKLNGDKRSTFLNTYYGGKKIIQPKINTALTQAVVDENMGFRIDTSG